MENLLLAKEPDPCVLRILKQYHTHTNGNNVGDDGNYNTFCLHSKVSTLLSIRNRTANFSVPDGILESLIIIEKLDRRRGVPPSDALREAFSAVAVHRTLLWLHISWDDYYDGVRRIWGELIKDLEVSGSSGLLSPGLANWRKEVEAALWDREISKRLVRINTLDEAMRRIRVYLREVFGSINPTADDVVYAPAYTPADGNVDDFVTASAEVTSSHHCTDKGNIDNVVIASVQAPLSPNNSTDKGNAGKIVSAFAQVPLNHHHSTVKVDDFVSAPAQVPSCPHPFTDEGNVGNAVSSAHDPLSCRHYSDEGNVDNAVSASAHVPLCPHRSTNQGNVDSAVSTSAHVPLSPHPFTNEGNEDNVVHTCAELPLSPHRNTDKGNVDNVASASDHVLSGPHFCKKKMNKILRANSHTKHKLHSSCRQHKGIVITCMEEDWPCRKNGSQSALVDEVTDSLSKALDVVETVASDTATNNLHAAGIVEDSHKDMGDPTNLCIDKGKYKVEDPLPKALEIAERNVTYVAAAKRHPSEGSKGNGNKEHRAPNDHTAEPSQAREEAFNRPKKVPRTSLMVSNGGNGNKEHRAPDEAVRKEIDKMDGSAPAPSVDHTAEPSQDQEEAFIMPNKWEDSVDGSSEGKDSCLNECTLPSPRTKHVPPLNINVPKMWERKRKVNRWTDEEEKALTEGVRRYGNQWKYILETNKEIFRNRSAIDLKDKWRNLVKR
ncbi:hypothetical protein F3Y22_tig00013285pilonHSYRG00341 [Hibiscus syriacus]|uniref:Uncharacterized protein n=1 Tax=Hibiscus syriacus TaxID=106335 RepID=A0A6A3C7I7_HIBSY|nr:uncharacterized protein LOC120205908 [Hibiscus syriacus]KAE8723102.1 hypothetical protein F3Y22_tig00013285pilonHSYRG00341 [Hibiscus syriacus]